MLVVPPVISPSQKSKKKNELFPKCVRTKQVTYPFSNIKSSQSALDYHELKRLQSMREESVDREQAHRTFMKQYTSVIKPQPKIAWINRSKSTRTEVVETPMTPVEPQPSSVSSSQLSTRRSRKTITPLQRDIQILRRLLRKVHVERSTIEHDQIFRIMTQFPQFRALEDRTDLLRQAVQIAHLEICEESKQPVLPSSGFYLVLKGSVCQPPTTFELPSLSPAMHIEPFTVGQCFGSLKQLPEGTPRSPWFVTTETNCEFLKIDKDEFATIKTKLQQVEYQEKWTLIRSCGEYKMWTKQPTDELLRLLEWVDFPANTILASESFRCPFIAFMKMGECHVLRKVDVVKTSEDGTKSRQLRQVVMGKISAPDSFGEISVLSQEAMTCTIVTSTNCVFGIVRAEKALDLPEVTRKLILHTAQRTFAHLSENDIRQEYIKQETRKEWTDLKKDIVRDVIDKKNIHAGRGKWQHSIPSPLNIRLTKSSMGGTST